MVLRIILLLFILNGVLTPLSGQTQNYKQVSNEIDFNHDLSKRWGLEINIGQSYINQPGQGNVFSNLGQVYGRVWAHFVPDDKWKLSFFYGYYYNEYVPEIDQRSSPEWRSAIQATYYIKHGKPAISMRWRIEDRHIQNTDTLFEAVERWRSQVKVVYPLNAESIVKGTWYAILSEEVMFKTKSKVSGPDFFDRNKATAGLGYSVTNNFQMEVTYCNEFLPRATSNSYHTLQFNVVINNFFQRLNRAVFEKNKRNEAASAD